MDFSYYTGCPKILLLGQWSLWTIILTILQSDHCTHGEECEQRSQSVLFSLDLNENDGNVGLLWGSEYRERLDKSNDGYPYIK